MSNVTLNIGGRSYTVACAAGEEAHVAGLGRMIDGRIGEMPGSHSLGETRGLLFAALLLADRVHELENATAAPGSGDHFPFQQFVAIAERLEALAGIVEAGG